MTTTTISLPDESSSARWLLFTLLWIALLVAVNLVFQWRMDVFGILRDPRGRSLITSHHEPKAKFLLNKAYVPANFDALIIGASASENWDTKQLTGYRFYNESIEGGNASMQRKMVEQALPTGHFKVAIVCMYPHITQSHGLFDGLDKTRPEEALGSLDAFTIEASVLASRFLHSQLESSGDGSHNLPIHKLGLPPNLKQLEIKEDPISVRDYQALIQELAARGAHVVYAVYPLYEPYYIQNKDQVNLFLDVVAKEYAAAPIINFNDPEYVSFRANPLNWIDEVHLSKTGAEALSPVLNLRLHEALRDR